MPSSSELVEQAHIVLVEDDPSQRLIMSRWLKIAGYSVTVFDDAESCLDHFDALLPDVVCLDLHLPGMDGVQALDQLRRQYPAVPVLVITGDSGIDTVVETMRLGAHDYLVKPVDRTRFETQVRNAALHGQLALKVAQLEREAAQVGYPGIIGASAPMRELYRQMDRIAASPVTVLIRGESGTGKELVAKAIHDHSANSSGPFVALNCAAIAESLQESELFGHEKGAFTGADARRVGRFEEADGGTLFLDEVAELSSSLQAKLLRVLQERTFRRLGGSRDLKSRFRLIAASHEDLFSRVEAGRFREDLLYRLAVFELDVPPLRNRLDDLPALAAHFLSDQRLIGDRENLTLGAEALEVLLAYEWPGNVRELANALQRAAVVAAGGLVSPHDLPMRIRGPAARSKPASNPAAAISVVDPAATVIARDVAAAAVTPPSTNDPARSVEDDRSIAFLKSGPRLDEIEAFAIERSLERHRHNLSAVARELGIGRNTLYRKIERYGLRSATPKASEEEAPQ